MKKLSKEFPWDETYRRLCGDPPDQSKLPLGRAKALIVEQRQSQLEVLARGMYGPKLATGAASEGDEAGAGRQKLPRFEFNDPERAARRFMRVAAQVGARLRPWAPSRLAELDPQNASLGRLLRLLAVAEEPAGSSGSPEAEWEELKARSFEKAGEDEPSPFGPVLGPMFVLAARADEPAGAESSRRLIRPLVTQLGTTDRLEALADWACAVVEAGARQIGMISPLSHARGISIGVGGMRFEFGGHGGPAHARDIVLAGPREENVDFLKEVRKLDGVAEEETGFIYEPAPGMVRVRAWSDAPLAIARLKDSADEANAKVIEVADETEI